MRDTASKKLIITSLLGLCGVLISSIALSVAWFSQSGEKITVKIDGALLESYFDHKEIGVLKNSEGEIVDAEGNLIPAGSEDNPFLITRPKHYENLIKLHHEIDGFAEGGYCFEIGKQFEEGGEYFVYNYNDYGTCLDINDATSHILNLKSLNELEPLGCEEYPFLATLEGHDNTLTNFVVSSAADPSTNYYDFGIFGYMGSRGKVSNLYFSNFVLKPGKLDASQAVRREEHVPHIHNAYIGYLCGHVYSSEAFQNVYLNGARMQGNSGDYAIVNQYGYFGFVEKDTDGASAGAGGNYEFSLKPETFYNYFEQNYNDLMDREMKVRAAKNYSGDESDDSFYNVSQTYANAVNNAGVSGEDKVANYPFRRGVTYNNSDQSYTLVGTYSNGRNKYTPSPNRNYSTSTLGYNGADYKTVINDYEVNYKNGSNYILMPEETSYTYETIESNPIAGNYYRYNTDDENNPYWEYYYCNNDYDSNEYSLTLRINEIGTFVNAGESYANTTGTAHDEDNVTLNTIFFIDGKQYPEPKVTENPQDPDNPIITPVYLPSTIAKIRRTAKTNTILGFIPVSRDATYTFTINSPLTYTIPDKLQAGTHNISAISYFDSKIYQYENNDTQSKRIYLYHGADVTDNVVSQDEGLVASNTTIDIGESWHGTNVLTSSQADFSKPQVIFNPSRARGPYPLYGRPLNDNSYNALTRKNTSFTYDVDRWFAQEIYKQPQTDSQGNVIIKPLYISDDPEITSMGYNYKNIDIVGGGINFTNRYVNINGERSGHNLAAALTSTNINKMFRATEMVPNSIVCYVNNVPPQEDGTMGSFSITDTTFAAIFGNRIQTRYPTFKKGGTTFLEFADIIGNGYKPTSAGLNRTNTLPLTEEFLKKASYCALDEQGKIVEIYDNNGATKSAAGGNYDVATYVLVIGVKNDANVLVNTTSVTRITNIDFKYKAKEGYASALGPIDYRNYPEKVIKNIFTFYFTIPAGETNTYDVSVTYVGGEEEKKYQLTFTSNVENLEVKYFLYSENFNGERYNLYINGANTPVTTSGSFVLNS